MSEYGPFYRNAVWQLNDWEEVMSRSRWFQIHLSTAVELMFVAGALLGANCVPAIRHYNEDNQAKLNYAFRHTRAAGEDMRDEPHKGKPKIIEKKGKSPKQYRGEYDD